MRHAGLQRLLEQVGALDDEAAFVGPGTAPAHQAPQPLDPLVPVGQAASKTSSEAGLGGADQRRRLAT